MLRKSKISLIFHIILCFLIFITVYFPKWRFLVFYLFLLDQWFSTYDPWHTRRPQKLFRCAARLKKLWHSYTQLYIFWLKIVHRLCRKMFTNSFLRRKAKKGWESLCQTVNPRVYPDFVWHLTGHFIRFCERIFFLSTLNQQ